VKEYVFRNRKFTIPEIELIRKIIHENKNSSRKKISKLVCEMLNWRQENGMLKEVACRDVLLRMHRLALIKLPPPKIHWTTKNIRDRSRYKFNIEQEIINGEISDFNKIMFELVNITHKVKLWNHLIDRYHYLGYKTIVGRHLNYIIYLDGKLIGCIGFADSVLKLNLRDRWIGWSIQEREKNLRFVINNNRFLILPWASVKNLASKVLSIAVKEVQKDWECLYGYRPVLVETFVDANRFKGTCYKAANWIYLGKTIGKGRRGMKYFIHNQPKDVYVYPLCKDYLKILRCNL